MDKSDRGPLVPVRYAVRQVLDQELRKEKILQSSVSRHARSSALPGSTHDDDNKENEGPPDAKRKAEEAAAKRAVKRDFFGRIINDARPSSADSGGEKAIKSAKETQEDRVWVSFHEGFSNAVRKPITLKELLESF